MELLQLRYFHSAAQLENFTRVAERYYVPQSCISRTIARLEEELHTPLFDRHGKRLKLNEAGRQFYACVDAALSHLDEGVARLTDECHEQLTVSIMAGSKWMPEVFSGFRRLHPQIRFALSLCAENEGNTADCTVLSLPAPAGLAYVPLMKEKILLAVPDTHPLAEEPAVSVNRLRQEDFIAFSKGKSMRVLTDRLCAEAGFLPHVVLECEDAATFRGLIRNRLGVAFVPEKTWQRETLEHVRLLPLDDPRFERTLALAWPECRAVSTGVRLFREYCRTWFAAV